MVAINPSQNIYVEEYRWNFSPESGHFVCWFPSIQVAGQVYEIKHSYDRYRDLCIGAFSASELVAIVKIAAPEGPVPYNHVGKIAVAHGNRGNGLSARLIRDWIVANKKPLLSDDRQTMEAFGVWSSLARKHVVRHLWRPGGEILPLKLIGDALVPDTRDDQSYRWLATPDAETRDPAK